MSSFRVSILVSKDSECTRGALNAQRRAKRDRWRGAKGVSMLRVSDDDGKRKSAPLSFRSRRRGGRESKERERAKAFRLVYLIAPLFQLPGFVIRAPTYLDSVHICICEAEELKEESPGACRRWDSGGRGGAMHVEVVVDDDDAAAETLAASPSSPLPPPLPLAPTPPLVIARRGFSVGNPRRACRGASASVPFHSRGGTSEKKKKKENRKK